MPTDIWTAIEPNFIWTAPEANYIWGVPDTESESDWEDSTDVDEFNDWEENCDCEVCEFDRVQDKLDEAQADIIRLTQEKSDLTSANTGLGFDIADLHSQILDLRSQLCGTAMDLQTAQSVNQQHDSRIKSLIWSYEDEKSSNKIATDTINSLSRVIAGLEIQKNYLNQAWSYPASHYKGIDLNLFGLWVSVRFNPLTLYPTIKFGCL